ncbi:hypothetical protein YPPY103_2075, partial [Yersinia pestis PY-103]
MSLSRSVESGSADNAGLR